MKKIILIIFISLLTLVSCSNKQEDNDKTNNDVTNNDIYIGSSTLTWHGNETFNCVVEVTIKNNVIEKVEIREGSYIHTGVETFRIWDENKEKYLSSYVGKTLEEIEELKTMDPLDPTDHYDGGSIEGCIDAISGATASSTVVAKAIKNAVNDALSEVK